MEVLEVDVDDAGGHAGLRGGSANAREQHQHGSQDHTERRCLHGAHQLGSLHGRHHRLRPVDLRPGAGVRPRPGPLLAWPSNGRVLHRSVRRPIRAAHRGHVRVRGAGVVRGRLPSRTWCRWPGACPSSRRSTSDEVQRVVREVLEQRGAEALQYCGGQGLLGLRNAPRRSDGEEGVDGDPEDVVVTTGAQQALDLVAKIFLDPGDDIVVEAPAYVGALSAFSAYQPNYLQVDLDDDGMIVDQLEDLLGARRQAQVRVHRSELPQPCRGDDVARTARTTRRPVP